MRVVGGARVFEIESHDDDIAESREAASKHGDDVDFAERNAA